MPPPLLVAVLPESVELAMLRVPVLKMPPPLLVAELPERVELAMLRVPWLLKAPPLLEVFAPEIVKPEMVRLPPVLMVKILKLPWLPLMIIESKPEALRPLMVTVPAVPPVTAVVVSMMFGNAEAKVRVKGMEKAGISMMSSPAVALASIIACRSEPVPESALVLT